MNVLSEIFYSVKGVKRYPEFLRNKKGKVVLYVAIIVLIYFAVAHVGTIPSTMEAVSHARASLMNFPDFELKSGKLQMEKPYYYYVDNTMVTIEPQYGSYIREYYMSDWQESLYYYDFALIMDETTVLVKNNGQIHVYDYPAGFRVSRDWVYGKLSYIYVIVAVSLVFSYLISFVGYFLTALLVALVGLIICSFMNQKLTFWQIYLLSIYAKTLPLFIRGLLKAIDYSFFGFSVLGFAIACLYVGFAIHHMDMLDEEKKRVDGPVIF